MGSKAANLPFAHGSNEGFVPEFFPGMDIREMHFNGRDTRAGNRIPESHTRMRVGSRVEDDHIRLAPGLLNPSHQFAFQICLPEIDRCSLLACHLADHLLDVRQRGPAIDFRFTLSEQVEIRSIQDEQVHNGKKLLPYRLAVDAVCAIGVPMIHPSSKRNVQASAGI